MRKLMVSLIVFALGLGAAALVISPGAKAHSLLAGTLTGKVGLATSHNDFTITLSASTVAPGTYQFNITDYATIHNFDLCKGTSCTGSNTIHKTSIGGTGSVSWTVTLAAGTYTYQCDFHPTEMKGHLVVKVPPVSITSVTATRTLVTVGVKATKVSQLSAVLLKGTTKLASAAAPAAATSATLKLKPSTALAPGDYVVQARAVNNGTSVFARKTIHVS
jgi:plastocyanin